MSGFACKEQYHVCSANIRRESVVLDNPEAKNVHEKLTSIETRIFTMDV